MGETKPINISDIRSSGQVVVKISGFIVGGYHLPPPHCTTFVFGRDKKMLPTSMLAVGPLLWSWNISMGIIDPMKCSYGLLGTAGQAIWAPSKLTHRCRSRITILKNPGLKTPKKYGIGRWHKVNTVAETSSSFGVAVWVMFEVSVLATATQLCLLFWKLSICWSIPILATSIPRNTPERPKKILLG